MSRLDVTEKIIATKVAKGLKWSDVAREVGLSKEWVTAACLGQMTLDAGQAAREILDRLRHPVDVTPEVVERALPVEVAQQADLVGDERMVNGDEFHAAHCGSRGAAVARPTCCSAGCRTRESLRRWGTTKGATMAGLDDDHDADLADRGDDRPGVDEAEGDDYSALGLDDDFDDDDDDDMLAPDDVGVYVAEHVPDRTPGRIAARL